VKDQKGFHAIIKKAQELEDARVAKRGSIAPKA
jgi:hypothetical protein